MSKAKEVKTVKVKLTAKQADDYKTRFADLTPQEANVGRLMAAGHSNEEVAQLLSISSKTLDLHRAHVKQKLGLDSTNGISVAVLSALGIVKPFIA